MKTIEKINTAIEKGYIGEGDLIFFIEGWFNLGNLDALKKANENVQNIILNNILDSNFLTEDEKNFIKSL